MEKQLLALQERFMQAVNAKQKGDIDGASEILRSIISIEPRLPEPHLELAHILIGVGQLEDGHVHAQEAVKMLEMNGQWVDDIPENVMLSLAYNTLGECLRRLADQDEIVFGEPDKWKDLIEQSRSAYKKAAALDPDNPNADYWGGFDGGWEET